MTLSRRDLSLLLPALAMAQDDATKPADQTLPSKAFSYPELAVKEGKTTKQRQFFTGATHTGYHIDMHETELAAGEMPHAAHSHVHEEMVMVREGTIEVTILGKSTRLGPGSAAYVASNEEHGWKNVGTGPARYFVIAFGRDS